MAQEKSIYCPRINARTAEMKGRDLELCSTGRDGDPGVSAKDGPKRALPTSHAPGRDGAPAGQAAPAEAIAEQSAVSADNGPR